VLKTTGAIKQVVVENRKPEFKVISYNQPYTKEVLDRIVSEDTERAMDLQNDSLFRVTVVDFSDERYMLMHTHHIIIDGWCLPILINDLQKYYGKLESGITVEALIEEINEENKTQTSYAEYVNWINKQNTEEVTEYWKSLLADSEPSHIYGKEKKDNTRNEKIVTFRRPIGEEATRNIEQFARENRVTANTVFECALGIALQKYSGNDDVVFDKVISGRSIPLKNIENTLGLFINTVPVRVQTNEKTTLSELLNETQKQTVEANAKGLIPLAEIYKTSEIEAKSIDTFFVFENYFVGDEEDIQKGPLSPESVAFEEQTEFNLTVTIMKDKEGYTVRTSYAEEMYTEGEINSFINGYISILTSELNKNTSVKDISVLTEEDKETILNKFNSTTAEYEKDKCIHELFEAQAERTPDKIALVATDKKLTY
jgi:hypothetical protein